MTTTVGPVVRASRQTKQRPPCLGRRRSRARPFHTPAVSYQRRGRDHSLAAHCPSKVHITATLKSIPFNGKMHSRPSVRPSRSQNVYYCFRRTLSSAVRGSTHFLFVFFVCNLYPWQHCPVHRRPQMSRKHYTVAYAVSSQLIQSHSCFEKYFQIFYSPDADKPH